MTLDAQQRLILAKAALIKRDQARERKSKLKAERKARGTADRGRERDTGFLAYLRRQPCEAAALGGCSGPIEAAHIRYSDAAAGVVNPGMGRKNHDRHANPLCHGHHQHDQHTRAERLFWDRLGKDAYATAAGHYAAYQGGFPKSRSPGAHEDSFDEPEVAAGETGLGAGLSASPAEAGLDGQAAKVLASTGGLT